MHSGRIIQVSFNHLFTEWVNRRYSIWPDFHPFGNENNNVLDLFDIVTNNFIMPFVALCTCIIIGYIVKSKFVEDEVETSGAFKKKGLYRVVIKYVAPVCLFLILVTSVLNAFQVPIQNALSAKFDENTVKTIMNFFVF